MSSDSSTSVAQALSPSDSAPETVSSADISALIGLVAKQDRAAFAKLYEATAPKLLGVVLRILKDRPWADDVIQEAYLKVWQRAVQFDAGKASPITWLVSVARNKAIDASGYPYFMEITNFPVTIRGEIVGVYGICRDISDRKN
jgi:RNA polymerase sigma-70 factor (ECF subfamily)